MDLGVNGLRALGKALAVRRAPSLACIRGLRVEVLVVIRSCY